MSARRRRAIPAAQEIEKLGYIKGAKSSMHPYYEQDGITIYHGDCREVLPGLEAGSVDLVFTRPPYNLGVTSGGGFSHDRHDRSGGRKGSKWDAPALAFGYGECKDTLPWPGWVAYLGPLPESVDVGNSTQAYIPSPRLRRSVLERDGYRCRHCGATEQLTIDHVRPASEGGPTRLENLQTLCRTCNTRKGPAHGRGTRHGDPVGMGILPHCPTCRCSVTVRADGDSSWERR